MWVLKNKELKHCLNLKKIAFRQGDKHKVTELDKEINCMVKTAVEQQFTGGNAREDWRGLNTEKTQCEDPNKLQMN